MRSELETNIEPVTTSEVLGISASWNRQRTEMELGAFLATREAAIADQFE